MTQDKRILYYPSPFLRSPCNTIDVNSFDEANTAQIKTIIELLKQLLNAEPSNAINAAQIGHSEQIIAFGFSQNTPPQDELNQQSHSNQHVLINPIIIEHSQRQFYSNEACRSCPGIRVNVPRYEKITVTGISESGESVTQSFSGIEAAIIQHQIDHINGKLLLDYLEPDLKPLYEGYIEQAKTLQERLSPIAATKDNSVIYNDNNAVILRTGDIISLYFVEQDENSEEMKFSGVMSTTNLRYPLALSNIYSQALMLSLVFNNSPTSLYMLGFGGGIVPMCFYHYFPDLHINGSEIDETVASLAQSHFGVKQDKRLQFSVMDGRKHLESLTNEQFDILLLDTFTGAGEHPDELATEEFYQLCVSRLKTDGVIGTNLVKQDPKFELKMHTFLQTFKYAYSYEHEQGNYICFGSNAKKLDQSDILHEAMKLQNRYNFMFPFYERAKSLKPVT